MWSDGPFGELTHSLEQRADNEAKVNTSSANKQPKSPPRIPRGSGERSWDLPERRRDAPVPRPGLRAPVPPCALPEEPAARASGRPGEGNTQCKSQRVSPGQRLGGCSYCPGQPHQFPRGPECSRNGEESNVSGYKCRGKKHCALRDSRILPPCGSRLSPHAPPWGS